MKKINSEELSKCNGKNENPVYIAHQGHVYDVSESKLWEGGVHMQRHHAGRDLTPDIQAAPHGPEVLERYPQVAMLLKEREVPAREMPKILSRLLTRFPILRRHPHPMTVHFPIVFMFSATMFTLLYLVTGIAAFELTGLHCLGAGIIFTPVVMGTGYFTWWLNYMAKPLRPVTIKQRVSFILLGIEVIAFVWRLTTPDILFSFRFVSGIYLILIIALFPLAIVVGWFGATLTFPIEKE
jgi:predicted heme/steroid binding protein/uncharacterized membrane protein